MSVYKPKGKPYYHYDFQVKGTRYHGSTGCARKGSAEQYVRDLRAEIAEGKRDKPEITLDEGAGVFWETKGKFDKNAKNTEYHISNLVRLIGARVMLHDIDDLAVSRFVALRRSENVRNMRSVIEPKRKRKPPPPPKLISHASVNRETELLKRILRFLSTRYRVGAIVWKNHKLREKDERVREASPDEEARLMDELRVEDPDLADLVEFTILSGGRRHGMVSLKWDKIDLKRGTASIHAKGDVWHTFPLTLRMKEIIANRPKVSEFVFTYECIRPSPPRKDRPRRLKGQRYPFSEEGWYRRWRRALKAAEVKDFRFHDLRHTAATRLVRSSGNIKAAQKLLGHTRIETTARYAHVTEDDLLRLMEGVDHSRQNPDQIAGLQQSRHSTDRSDQNSQEIPLQSKVKVAR